MTKGCLFHHVPPPTIGRRSTGTWVASTISGENLANLQTLARSNRRRFLMRLFRLRSAVSRALVGKSVSTSMPRAFKPNPCAIWRHMRLVEVVSPGTEENMMVEGITENNHREFKTTFH